MQLVVRSIHLDGSDALHEYAARKVERVLRFAVDPATRVLVSFSDANGPRGGEDKLCRIHLGGHRTGAFVEAVHVDSYAALDLAVERLAHAVRRQTGRRRTGKHGARSLRVLSQEVQYAPQEAVAAE